MTGERLDNHLTKKWPDITRSQISGAIKSGDILVNGGKVKSGYILRTGDEITGEVKDNNITATPEDIPLEIVYEDDYLMVINKPRGMVVHPGAGVKSGTLLNGLLGRAAAGELFRAGIVHRLDKNTAGLLIVAKTAKAQELLSAMFASHEIKRTYIGLVEGRITGDMTINKNIIRDPKHRTLFAAVENGGRRAVTHLKVSEQFQKYTLCEFILETGRTHQIRVHCKSVGHPIVGDPEYNPAGAMKNLPGQMLEAVKLEFIHPVTNKNVNIAINPSNCLTNIIIKCKYTI
jgi:23S rRNA pseudouridine1911/1915/1917 synthase